MTVFYEQQTTIICDRCRTYIGFYCPETDAMVKAREEGWTIGTDTSALCPECSEKQEERVRT